MAFFSLWIKKLIISTGFVSLFLSLYQILPFSRSLIFKFVYVLEMFL